MQSILETLRARGLIQDASNIQELDALLKKQKVTFYCGFDPTADSLHAGSMLPLIIMRRLQAAGHKPIVVLGSATGMIGDPSGKSEERNLLTKEEVEKNAQSITKQIRLFLSDKGDNGYLLLKNHTWLDNVSYIEFLRDTGKHFSVNSMLSKDSVKSRISNREQGISYTEFSYMLLQAYDFYWLYKNNNCCLQVGGSDQWGNITAGLELIRRKCAPTQASVYGLTFPLLTTSAGTKFGKTETGAVWLDPKKTSPYQFYQFWFNTSDDDVINYLNLFSGLELLDINELALSVKKNPDSRAAQKALAEDLATLVHGETETKKATQASSVLFGDSIENVDAKTLLDIFKDVPSKELSNEQLKNGLNIVDLVLATELVKSKSEVRRLIEGGGIYLNNNRVDDVKQVVFLKDAIEGSVLILRTGKKNYCLLKVGR